MVTGSKSAEATPCGPGAPEPRSRRRGEALERAILEATWAELAEVGYTALTIEGVAERAGTSKPVIYRRWSNRAELVLAAWFHRRPGRTSPTPPDTGSLRADLVILFTRIARQTDSMLTETIAGVMGEAFRHPEIAELLRERLKSAPLSDSVRRIVAQAVARGELTEVDLPNRVTRLPIDLIRNDNMLYGPPVHDEAIGEMVDQVFLPLLRGISNS